MTTKTTTRQISPRTAIAAYKRTARALRPLAAQMANPFEIREGYREIVENAWMEQVQELDRLMQHPALAGLSDAELEALAA